MMLEKDPILPSLRNDIHLNEAPAEPEGAPSWTLYDPAADKYYKIGWLEFECLSRFNKYQTAIQLIKAVKNETTLNPDDETINNLIEFLITHNLIYVTNNETMNHFETQLEERQKSWWKQSLHGYIFFSIPIFKPEKFLKTTFPFINFLFTRPFITSVFLLLAFGVFLSIQRFDEIANTFLNYLSLEGVILFLSATIIVKIIHELGHAYTAIKYGVPVTTIGVAFIVLYPILYTETTNAWQLKDRKQRITIALSGIMAELTLSAIALLLWHILPPGILQSLCFMVAIVSIITSLIVNLNPLMKFDGYYLFSDLVAIDNLQDRSFAFAKWRLRKFLWGWNTERPEIVDSGKQKLLTIFGFSIWVYRFFLYVGIAIIVYNLFFQPLGLILMIIELVFFLGLPAFREIKHWVNHTGEILTPLRGKLSLFIYVGLLSFVFIPIPQSIEIPVTLHAKDYIRYYSPVPAKIEEIKISKRQKVQEGEILFRLSSDQLEKDIKATSQRLKDLKAIQTSSQANQELANRRVMIRSEIENTKKELEGLNKVAQDLVIKAQFSGTVKKLEPSLRKGQWVNTQYMLALLAKDDEYILSGYIREADVEKLTETQSGKFYADYSPFEQFDVSLVTIEESIAKNLFWAELSSVQGGPIPSEAAENGNIRTLPKHSVYPVQFDIDLSKQPHQIPNFIARGSVIMSSEREVLAKSLFKKGISLFIAEGGL